MGDVCLKNLKPYLFPIMAFVILDQLMKLIIKGFYMGMDTNLIGSFIRFRPVYNTDLSFGGNYIGFLSNMWILILLNILILWIIFTGYAFYKTMHKRTSIIVYMIMIFGIAGCICSLLDKILWGGSLDFLQIPDVFTFDLKDCYLTIGELLFIIIALLHNKEISFKAYIQYCRQTLKLYASKH